MTTGFNESQGGLHDDRKTLNQAVQTQFSKQAIRYEDSPVHAHGEDLPWVAKAIPFAGHERVLDLGTGTGHTAFALAPHVGTVMGLDLTARMVTSAAKLAEEKGLTNVQFVLGDAVSLPFPDDYFDIVSCRFAAHHFAHPDGAAREIGRVLRPGGHVLFIDHVAPDTPELDTFINRIDWLRDNSHVREWTVPEWTARFQQAGVVLRVAKAWNLHMDYRWWLEQAATPEARRQETRQMFQAADDLTRRTFCVKSGEDGEVESFALTCALMVGVAEGQG